ncbi:receptor-like protein EIX2 [Lotus japonicus]|uniref:receptor-like protein EIX2 n=1 Tax=Lotus japonicus TaxID=34305 RepID=UPI0025828528|nr:receptor-like protein EIX2 [Lotus japonicus]
MMRSSVSLKFLGAICVVSLLLHQHLPLSNYYKASAAEQVGCIEKERHTLLELKAGLVLDDTTLLPSWKSDSGNSSTDCCEWKGVSCSKKTGHVEMLDLNGDHFGPFRGEISSSLIKLKHLKHLNLSRNRFIHNPPIPSFFGSLSRLRLLDLKGSHFGGRIPNDLANLSHLQYLDLSSNNLEGTIPQQLGNLSHLQYLDLGVNSLVGTIPHQLCSLSNLQELHLGYTKGLKIDHDQNHEWSNLTHLTHLDLSQVHNLNRSHAWLQMIGMLPKLQKLVLYDCDLSDLFLRSLSPSALNFSTSLTILDLSRNNFTSSLIFQWVFNACSNITQLDLSLNNLEGPILYDFGNIRNPLAHLYLSYNNELQGGILESISNICTLRTLYIDSINLNEDISTILLSFSGCARSSLQIFSLFYNQISGTLSELSMFPSLKELDLSDNQLNGKLPEADKLPSKLESLIVKSNSLQGGIPKSFGNICSLVSLHMSNNKLSEELSGIIHNLSCGCAKHSLQELRFDGNQITGTVSDMSVFTSLVTLVLSHNLLNGTIPENIRFPPQLKNLNMESNNLEGVISDSHFANMYMLKSVKLSYNPLVLMFSENWIPPFQLVSIFLSSCMLGPKFPTWLQTQKYMYELDISNAGISDAVPMLFWYQTTMLKYMNISHNNLTGTVPNLPIRFYVGCHVLLASNQFTGSIPSFLRSAGSLDLSSNKFSDSHELLCANTTIDELGILDLSNNQLPRLPDCWSNFKALVFLDLSDNTLSGKVPHSMGSLLELKVLILRNNNLTGKLPISLRNCAKLVMLDLGENRLSGAIPSWLGQELQMLSLRRNQFSGSLPHNLCFITSIQLLDLSANNLRGRIFKCLKNFTAMSKKNFSTSNMVIYISKLSSFFATYDLNALLVWKGAEQVFKNNKLLLRSIDLSSNQLTGDIPEEIGDLVGLVSLNISSNNLSGEITSKIGRLTSLEFLDLSRNHFFGSIPPTLAQIDRLAMLDLSYNNLCGRIPLGTQLQSFDASSYEGNADLCGKPLDKKCPGDEEAPQEPKSHKETSPEDNKSIYLSVALGFITGFWSLWGSLLLSDTWRHTYMLFLNNIIDTVYVFTAVSAAKFQRWLKGLMEKY